MRGKLKMESHMGGGIIYPQQGRSERGCLSKDY